MKEKPAAGPRPPLSGPLRFTGRATVVFTTLAEFKKLNSIEAD